MIPKKIVVLGGTGFIGKKMMACLQTVGYNPFNASRASGLDLNDYQITFDYFKKIQPDIIFNCAAHVGSLHYVTTYAATVLHDNMQMALNLYKAVAQTSPNAKIINPLSNCSYPGEAAVQVESGWWDGPVHDSVFSYGNAKRFIYVLSKCYEKQFGIKSVNLLVPNTFGPGDTIDPNKTHALNGMIIRMLEAQKRGEAIFEIWGTGSPIREWAYVDDVVNAMLLCMELSNTDVEPINMGQNKGYSIKESAEYIAEAAEFTGQLTFNATYKDGAPVKILDNGKFRKFFPEFIFFNHKKGIAETIKYYRSQL